MKPALFVTRALLPASSSPHFHPGRKCPPDNPGRRPCTAAIWTALLLLATGLAGPLALPLAAAQTNAVYSELKPDAFMTRWLVLAPISVAPDATPNGAMQRKAFDEDQMELPGKEGAVPPTDGAPVSIAGKDYAWRLIVSPRDIVDLTQEAAITNFSIAYAWAEVRLPTASKGLLGIGSDDGVKVWLNGQPVHTNWASRSTRPDSDVVPVQFRAGTNHLLLKIQNMRGSWSFACRWLGQETLTETLVAAIAQNDQPTAQLLLDQGLDVNAEGSTGLTAVQWASILGESEFVELLVSRGADAKKPLPPLESLIDRLFTKSVEPKAGGIAVLVAKDGQILLEKGYGLANIENEIPVTPETKFRIGSISKQFTAAAILKLQEEDKLNVTDKLSKFLPDYPRGDEVTIHHLLTHTSGIHSYTGKPDFMSTVTVGVKPLDHIQSFKEDPYDFDPGQKWSYNNSGYFLLGYIIELVSKQSYGEYLRQTFFEPLGMKDTGVHEPTAILPHEATGYSWREGQVKKAIDWDMSKAGGAGALYSTVRDLYRWNEALFNGQVLSESSRQAAFAPVRTKDEDLPEPKEGGYGYGWGIQRWRGVTEIGHSGGLDGFLSNLLRLPEHDWTVVVLMNCAPPPPGAEPGTISHRLTELYLHEKLPPQRRPKVDLAVSVESLDALTGRYDYGQAIMVVRRKDNQLFAKLGGQPEFPIFASSETNFFWKVVDARVTFVKDDQGKVAKAIHEQGGSRFSAPRVE